MRGNRRYVMSRANRRVAPTDSDEAGSLPSVDTDFLRKLINTGDTGFIDDLVGKAPSGPPPSESSRDDELKYMKPSRRWPYVLFGMGLMYFFIVLTEANKTKDWWRFYMTNLKSIQSTNYDSMGLRGSTLVEEIEVPSSNLFKSAEWEQSGAMFASNGQQHQHHHQQQQQQQPQYPRIAGGLSTGTLGQQQQNGGTAGMFASNGQQQLQHQPQYPRIEGGLSSGTLAQQQQYPRMAGPGMNSASSGMQSDANSGGGYVSQATSSALLGRINNGNAMTSLGGGGQLLEPQTNNRVVGTSRTNVGGSNMQYKQQTNGQLFMAGNAGQQDVGIQRQMGNNFAVQP